MSALHRNSRGSYSLPPVSADMCSKRQCIMTLLTMFRGRLVIISDLLGAEPYAEIPETIHPFNCPLFQCQCSTRHCLLVVYWVQCLQHSRRKIILIYLVMSQCIETLACVWVFLAFLQPSCHSFRFT